jgi:hypothetical protein
VSAGLRPGPSPLRSRATVLGAGLAAFAGALGVTWAAAGGGSDSGARAPVGSLAVPIERAAAGGGDVSLVGAEARGSRAACPRQSRVVCRPGLGAVEALPALALPEADPAPAVPAPSSAVSVPPPSDRSPAGESQAALPASPPPAPVPPPAPAPPPEAVAPAPAPRLAPDRAPAPPAAAPDPQPVEFDDSG